MNHYFQIPKGTALFIGRHPILAATTIGTAPPVDGELRIEIIEGHRQHQSLLNTITKGKARVFTFNFPNGARRRFVGVILRSTQEGNAQVTTIAIKGTIKGHGGRPDRGVVANFPGPLEDRRGANARDLPEIGVAA